MANTYNWIITAMDCSTEVPDKPDYVVTAHWTCVGTDGATPPYTASVYSTCSFMVDSTKPNYIPFDQLTEAEVVGWVQASLTPEGVAAAEKNIDTQIENQINPPIVQLPLPWQTSSSPA